MIKMEQKIVKVLNIVSYKKIKNEFIKDYKYTINTI
jgi:hypothetical protein